MNLPRFETAPLVVTTARLRGRRPVPADIDYLVGIDTDWQVQKTLFGKLSTREESDARMQRWLDGWEEHGISFWIFSGANGEDVGHAGLFPSQQIAGRVELGYAVRRAFWGRGYATEMARSVLDIAFDSLALERIVANAMPDNTASRVVLERAGFTFARESLYLDGSPNVEYEIARR